MWNAADILHRSLYADHLFLGLSEWRHETWELIRYRESVRNSEANQT